MATTKLRKDELSSPGINQIPNEKTVSSKRITIKVGKKPLSKRDVRLAVQRAISIKESAVNKRKHVIVQKIMSNYAKKEANVGIPLKDDGQQLLGIPNSSRIRPDDESLMDALLSMDMNDTPEGRKILKSIKKIK